jgi:hypothetical protein
MSGVAQAMEEWLEELGDGCAWAQVWVSRTPSGFDLRHVVDREGLPGSLRKLEVGELRDWADEAANGAFRPLKSAPNLRAGWHCWVGDAGGLEEALDILYPGSVADWWVTRHEAGAATSFGEYFGRQTGMYRVAQRLNEGHAALAFGACCAPRFCLKRRLWEVPGLAEDREEATSRIPCLEPCAIALEFGRRTMKLGMEERQMVGLGAGESATLLAALEMAAASPLGKGAREGDLGSPSNPRRFQLLLDRLRTELPEVVQVPGEG